MGFLDEIGALAGQGGQTTQVAGGLLQALEQHPGGIGGLLNSIKGNGMEDHVNAWASGQQATATPEQVQQRLDRTGLIQRAAAKAGESPAVVTMALTTLLAMGVQHFAPNGDAASTSQFGGPAQQLLGKFL
jgi:uncharacterized protein YidB (DUF937 family)